MPFAIITTTHARKDIQEAIEWENKRKPGLLVRFFEDLYKKNIFYFCYPRYWQHPYDNIRCTTTKIFTDIIHYIVDDSLQQVIILRVLHSSGKPIW